MGTVHQFEPRRPQEPDNPHAQGEVVCGACEHRFRGVAKVGDPGSSRDVGQGEGFECPRCHARKGIFSEFVTYSKAPTWHCECCRGWLFCIILAADGTPCVQCANCGQLRNAIDLFNK
jgi:hypothetical protein